MSYISEDDSEFDFFINQSRPKSTFETQHSYKAGLYVTQPVEHFLNFDEPSEGFFIEEPERMPEQTTKQMLKMKNRLKAKRFRDKKKALNETTHNKLKELESQNALLKQSKVFCGRCKTKIQKPKTGSSTEEQHHLKMEFEQPKLAPEKSFNGKIWIALGIIMLIIGVNLHGFNKQPIQINLHNSFVSNLQKEIQSDSSSVKIPFSIQSKSSMLKEPPGGKTPVPNENVLVISGGENNGFYSEEMLEIKKDFIMRLHGEINDIGNYL